MTPFDTLVARSAGPSFAPLRLILGLALVLSACVIASLMGMSIAVMAQALQQEQPPSHAQMQAFAAHPHAILFATLTGLSAILPSLWIAQKLLHDRGLRDILGVERRIRLGTAGIGAIVALAGGALVVALGAFIGGLEVTFRPVSSTWFVFAALMTVMVILQASGEELVFRGYLLQALAARFRNPLIWAAAPSLLFAMTHYSPEAGAEFIWIASATILFGVFASALVVTSGGLSSAIGYHIGHNVMALIILDTSLGLSGIGPIRVEIASGAVPLMIALDALILGPAFVVLTRLSRAERLATA